MDIPLTYRNILVAADFSPCGNTAAQHAMWLARRSNAKVTIAHVIPDFSLSVHWGPAERDAHQRELHEKAEAAFRQLVTDLSATDLDITCKTLAGEPFVELTRMIPSSGFDLLLAGTRGASKWEQFFVGSTSKRLIRKCPSSVWIVKPGHPLPPKVVVAATDFSDVSLKATREGLAIAQLAGATFHLVHCIDSKDVPDDVISRIPPGSSLRKEINDEATRRLNQFLQSLSVDSTQIHSHLTWGTPWQEIQKISVQQGADLVVIGTVGRSGIKGLLLGNTADRILETCDCGVLTVKPDDFVSPIQAVSEAG